MFTARQETSRFARLIATKPTHSSGLFCWLASCGAHGSRASKFLSGELDFNSGAGEIKTAICVFVACFQLVANVELGDEGLEPTHEFTVKAVDRERGDAESDASAEVGSDGDLMLADVFGLAVSVEAWPMWPKLSADAQRAVLEFRNWALGAAVTSDRAE